VKRRTANIFNDGSGLPVYLGGGGGAVGGGGAGVVLYAVVIAEVKR